jgi:predicted nucleic acid-binding protein
VALLDEVGAGPVGLDTAAFIYLIEEHETYLPVVEPAFAAIDGGRIVAVTSALTLLEVLVVPLRAADAALARQYEALLAGSRGLDLAEVSRAVLRDAAALRAATGMRAPDAIQIATALQRGCTSFVTNGRALPALPGLAILQLSDFVPRRSGRPTPRVSER